MDVLHPHTEIIEKIKFGVYIYIYIYLQNLELKLLAPLYVCMYVCMYVPCKDMYFIILITLCNYISLSK
jgi:hypothetical protein